MAEKGAHLSATFVKKPSIFELIAQDALANTFYPAFRQLANYLISQNPFRYQFLAEWFEEFYLGFNFFLQYHYLKNYDALFSERFYSLKRIIVHAKHVDNHLSRKYRLLSLIFSVLLPYLRNKLGILAEAIENGEESELLNKIPKQYHQIILRLHKSSYFLLESLCIIYYFRYMIGRSETHSLLLKLAGVTLIYHHDQAENGVCWKTVLKDMISGNWRSSLDLLNVLKGFCGRSLEICAFFIQFLSWWHSEQLHSKFTSYPIPPPPQAQLEKTEAAKFENICPICRNVFRIPTAVSVSGYVFCFKCVKQYIMKHGKCPVTNLPAKEDDLIRIFVHY